MNRDHFDQIGITLESEDMLVGFKTLILDGRGEPLLQTLQPHCTQTRNLEQLREV